MKPLTKHQLYRAMMRVPNVVAFCDETGLSWRTAMRLRQRDNAHAPSRRTIERFQAALINQGIIKNEEESGFRRMARRNSKTLA